MVAFFNGVIGKWLPFFKWSGRKVLALFTVEWSESGFVWLPLFSMECSNWLLLFYRVVRLGGLFSMVRSRVYGLWRRGGRVMRWFWENFQYRGVLQFG